MIYIIFFIIIFLFVNIIYNLFVIRKEKALKQMKNNKELLLLCKLNNIDVNKLDLKNAVKLLGLGNSIIIALLATLVLLLNKLISNFYIWILTSSIGSIILLIPVILITYKIIGKVLKKEGK